LVVAKVRERLAVSNFTVLENLEDSGDINRACENIRENIKISAQESLGYCESKCGDFVCSRTV
jgi:hypothetical protein